MWFTHFVLIEPIYAIKIPVYQGKEMGIFVRLKGLDHLPAKMAKISRWMIPNTLCDPNRELFGCERELLEWETGNLRDRSAGEGEPD
jgi:hypothetical protein